MILRLGSATFGVDLETTRGSLKMPYIRNGLVNVLEGISRYGVTRPQRLAAPFLVVWNFTNACNLSCKHCYQRADKPSADELSTAEAKSIIDQLDELNVSSIAFSGGEPLMRRDFFEVAGYAAGKGLYVSVATNGTMLTEKNVERLRQSGVSYVEVSIDGASSDTHDSFRGTRGAFNRTIDGIRKAVNAGLFTGIATVSTRKNLYEIPEIVKLANGLGVGRLIVFNFIPTGRGEEIVDIDLSPEQRENLLKYLYKELSSGSMEALSTAPQYARVCLQQSLAEGRDITAPTHFAAMNLPSRTRQLAEFLGGCGAGRLYCAIQPNGLVTPCVFMPIVIGDLRRQSLREIWSTSKVLRDLSDREALKGRCGRCLYKYICGGCRARAYAYYGDYLAPDLGCIREREDPSSSFSRQCLKTCISAMKNS
ncbi:radical SAM protein [Candidatus Bathyarchaeota archaeon]|nr:radical SAM protein [Candidatus Bathyarchaeota archaeon]